MPTGENAPRETLKAKNEAPRPSTPHDRPATEEDKYEQQLQGKLDILKNALLDLKETYPKLNVKALSEQLKNMANAGDLAFQEIEELTDHLSIYVLSDQGVARVNQLIAQKKTGEIIDTLKLNLAAYDTISLLDIPERQFQIVYQEIQNFKKVIISTRGKGKEYKGSGIYYPKTGEVWADFFLGDKEATQSQSSEITPLPEQSEAPQEEEEEDEAVNRIMDIENLPSEEREAMAGRFVNVKESILGKNSGEENEEPDNDKPKEESDDEPLDSIEVEKTSSLKTRGDLEESEQ